MKTVERGAAFLDDVYPEWWAVIDTDTLKLDNTQLCVLGQLYKQRHPRAHACLSPYDSMVQELLGGDYRRPPRLGFITWRSGRWDTLTQAWRREIERRRAA